MDFLDPKKKRAHQTRLFIGYGLIAAIIAITTLLLVFQAYGYNFNLKTGDITQNGLLFLDAHPESANIYLNGESKGSTARRLIVPAGEYNLEMRREGYRTWKHDFFLAGGTIERFVYPFLFPEQLETNEMQLFSTQPGFATQSPDRRWLLVQQPGGYRRFSLSDLNTELASSATLTLPESLLTKDGTSHKISLVEWSTDNRHVLLRHDFKGGYEYFLFDREKPDESVNLSKRFSSVPFTDITLRDKKFDRYYLHDRPSQRLRTAELGRPTASVILNDVLQFRSHGDDVLIYVTDAGAAKGMVGVNVRYDNETYKLKEFSSGSRYLLDVARFDGMWYMVAGSSKDEKTYVFKEPVRALRDNPDKELLPEAILRLKDAEYVSFSANARIIAVQAGSRFAVYDSETERYHRYDTELQLKKGQKATWMDGHRLLLIGNGSVEVFDFNGINRQTLSASYTAFTPYFDRDYTALYTLAPSRNVEGRAALFRTELIVDPNRE